MPITAKLKQALLDRLRDPKSLKATGQMHDPKTGGMCCLGHTAYILGARPGSPDNVYSINMQKDGQEVAYGTVLEDSINPGLTTEERYVLSETNDDQKGFPFEEIEALEEMSDEYALEHFPIYKELTDANYS